MAVNGKDETSPLVPDDAKGGSFQIKTESEDDLSRMTKKCFSRTTLTRAALVLFFIIVALIVVLLRISHKCGVACTITDKNADVNIIMPKDTSNINYRPLCEIYENENAAGIKMIQTSMANPHLQWAPVLCSKADSKKGNDHLNTYKVPDAIVSVNFKKLAYEDRDTPIIGFGGAFTEASALNYNSLSKKAQNTIMELLYGKDGLGYSIGRVHINSCDFSVEQYSFDDVDGDFELEKFDMTLNHDVRSGMIEMMKQAQEKLHESWAKPSGPNGEIQDGVLNMFASPWSPPAWMKEPTYMDVYNHTGRKYASTMLSSSNYTETCIRDGVGPDSKYAKAWALYYSKFITAYKNLGIKIFAVTVQNEPEFDAPWEACKQSIRAQGEFIANHLGPSLRELHPDVQLLIFDHNKDHVLAWTEALMGENIGSSKFVDGIAVHWYTGGLDRVLDGTTGSPNMHTLMQDLRNYNRVKNTLVIGSEACHCPHTGYAGGDFGISWERAEMYAHAILSDLAAGSNGWTEWNLLLDAIGGPNKIGNLCDTSLLAVPHRALRYKNSSEIDIEEPGPLGYPLSDFETFEEDPFGAIIGDLRTNEELNNMGMPARYLNQGIVVQPMYYYMGHISRYVRPGSRAVRAIVEEGNGIGRAFRPAGQKWAGGGVTKFSRVGIEITTWPCEGSTKQHFYYNKKRGTIEIGGHDWKGLPIKSCIGNEIHADYKGMTLRDCNSTMGEVGYYDIFPISKEEAKKFPPNSAKSGGSVKVKIQLKNIPNSETSASSSCLLVGPHDDGGGGLGQRGGARVILGDCGTPAALWDYSEEYGEFSSSFFEEGEVCMTAGWPFLQVGAFNTPAGNGFKHVVVVLNTGNEPANYALKDENSDSVVLTSSIPSRSIQTISF